MAYTVDTKVGDLLKDTHAVEVLEKHVPGISNNPMIGMASGMTIKSLLAMPQEWVTKYQRRLALGDATLGDLTGAFFAAASKGEAGEDVVKKEPTKPVVKRGRPRKAVAS